MLKNNKKFAIKVALATAAITTLAFEIETHVQKIRILKAESNAYKQLFQSQKDLTNLIVSDFEKVNDIEHLNNVKAYWGRILNKD